MIRSLPDDVTCTIAGIYIALAMASIAVRLLRWRKPQKDYTELALRIRTWWFLVGFFTLSLLLSRGATIIFFAFVSFLALKEFFSMIPTRRADRRVLFWAYLAIPVQYYWVHREWYGMFIVFIPVYMFLLLPMRMVVIGQTKGFLHAVGTIHWGLMMTVFSISHAAYLLVLRPAAVPDSSPTAPGPGLLLTLLLLTELNDVAQYCWGKTLGRRPITPTVSPHKTWAGFLGGLITTTATAAALGPWLTPMTRHHSAMAGAIIAVVGFIGDVTVSAIKRDIGIKDTGSTLPGHGGVLDRIDSLTYTAPVFFHYVHYLYF